MFAAAPMRWTDPRTWPWLFWVWLAIVAAGRVKPAWQWWRRRLTHEWPTAPGCIESTGVQEKSGWLRNRDGSFVAELRYLYSVEGRSYDGTYRQEFPSEAEAEEFVRELQGKPVMASYDSRDPGASTLTEQALTALLQTRTPLPQEFQIPVGDVPGWAKPLLAPCVVMAAIGLALSAWVHIASIGGKQAAPSSWFFLLHIGIFVVWFPAVMVASKRVGRTHRKDFWKVVLRGAPDWMRYLVYGLGAYAFVHGLLAFGHTSPQKGSAPGVSEWRAFSAVWMVFYGAGLAILYAALHPESSDTQ